MCFTCINGFFFYPPSPTLFLHVVYMNQIKHIRLDKIRSPEFASRLTKSPEEDDDLRDSIRELGILEPLLVKETSEGLEIIAGNRRFTQAGRAGLAAVPCIISNASGAEADKIKLHENLKRLPLSHVDQAYTFAHLVKEYKMTETHIATLIGKSIAYVSQHLSLLQCDDNLIQAVQDSRINFSIARELIQCKDPDERTRLHDIIERHGASTEIVHNWVHESNRETEHLNEPANAPLRDIQPDTPPIPMYPCAACEVAIVIPELKILRLCPECYNLIFTDIEREKQKARLNLASKTPIVPS